MCKKLNRYKFKQRKQIHQRIQEILKHRHCQTLITYEIHTTREYRHNHPNKGRPIPGSAAKVTWKPIYSISFEINLEALHQEEKTDGVFPLISNLDKKTHSPKKILKIYKFQPFLEKRNSQIKTYQEIAPVYLKNGKRVVAFLHIHVMALMVATLIERKLRLAMKSQGISSLPLYPENRPCKTPTMFDIVRFFHGVERYEVYENDKITIFSVELTKAQKDILNLLRCPSHITKFVPLFNGKNLDGWVNVQCAPETWSVRDGMISLAVNGKTVTRGVNCNPYKGYICLESEGSEVHFRNIRIKELPAVEPPEAVTAPQAEGFVSLYNGLDLRGWKVAPGSENHWKADNWI